MIVNPPDPPDIHSILEQLDSAVDHVPDWLWQNVLSEYIAEGTLLAAYLALKHRKKIAEKLRWLTLPAQTIHAGYSPSEEQTFGATVVELEGSVTARSSATGTLTVGRELQALWNTRSTVGKELTIRHRTEAPTPPPTPRLVDEGLELLAWYLRHL